MELDVKKQQEALVMRNFSKKRYWFIMMITTALVNMTLPSISYSDNLPKLILHWQFDNMASNVVQDASGNNNHGIIKGTVTQDDGPNGKCAVLNGAKGVIYCEDNDLLNPPYITIECLLCPLAWGGGNLIIDKGWNNGWGIEPHFYGSEIHFCANIGGLQCDAGKGGASNGDDFKTNEWAHMAITYNGANICIYKNGQILRRTNKNYGSWGTDNYGPIISGRLNSAGQVLRVGGLSPVLAKIDEVKLYAGALTSNEVLSTYTSLYSNGISGINRDMSRGHGNVTALQSPANNDTGKTLVINGCKYITNAIPLFEIYTATNASEITTYAANELKAYFDKIFACKVNICATNGPVDTNKLGVVIVNYKTASRWNVPTKPARPDGFEVQCRGKCIYIIGHDSERTKRIYTLDGAGPAGTLFGVYRFLDKMGVYWFFPGEEYEVLPEANAINITIDNFTDHPYFVYRLAGTPPGVDWKWMWRIGYGAAVYPAYTLHSFAEWPKKYALIHPEYLNLLDNNQRGTDLCWWNPQVQVQIIKDAKRFFETHDAPFYPDYTILRNDGLQPCCKCKLCQEHVIPAQGFAGEMSDSMCEVAIQLAKEVKIFQPNRRVVIGAYNSILLPPVRLKENFPDNVSVHIAKNRLLLWDEQSKKRLYEDIIRGWMKYQPATISFWEYYNADCWGGGKWNGLPMVAFALIKNDIKTLYDMSEKYSRPFLGEMIFTDGRSDEFAKERLYWLAPCLYVTAKMLWHPEDDLNQLLDKHYSVYFGKAGPVMKEFYGTLEAIWSSGKWGKNYFGGPGQTWEQMSKMTDYYGSNSPWDRLFSPSVIKNLIKNLSDAKDLAKVQPYKRRLELVEYGFKYTVYQYMRHSSTSMTVEESIKAATLK